LNVKKEKEDGGGRKRTCAKMGDLEVKRGEEMGFLF
jgi:hypothetical protein